MVGFKNNP